MSEQVTNLDDQAESVAVMSEVPVGKQLQAARAARGLQSSDIAQTLKLGVRQVEALENGDWSALPGPTFIRGSVRNYARLVQIDTAPLMAQLDRVLARPVDNLAMHENTPAAMPNGGSRISRRDRSFVLFGASLVALAALVYVALPSDISALRDSAQSLIDSLSRKEPPASEKAAAAPTATSNEPLFPPGTTPQQVMHPQPTVEVPPSIAPPAVDKPVEVAPVATSSAAVDKPQLRFLVEKESWIEVRDRDNKVIFSQRQAAGSEQSIAGKGPLSLTIGYAPGVRLFWNGQAIDLAPHSKGDVARLVLE